MANANYDSFSNIKTSKQKEKEAQTTKILSDIEKISESLESGNESLLNATHLYIDGKYSAYVPNWGRSTFGYIDGYGFNYEVIGRSSLIQNLTIMKAQLEGYMCNFSQVSQIPSAASNISVNVNNSNEVNLSVTFEQVRSQIEEMTSLTDEQTKEVLEKITEIETAYNEGGSKKSKWEKIKPVLIWLADKSFDVGMTLLPLLLKLGG